MGGIPPASRSSKVRLVATSEQHPWGRVDETGTVFVREGDGERVVGAVSRRHGRRGARLLRAQVHRSRRPGDLLEQRAKRGAPAADIAKSRRDLRKAVDGANAVGDLASLQARLDALGGTVEELTEQQTAEAKAAVAAAIAERTAIVERGRGARRRKTRRKHAVEAGRAPRSTLSSPAGRRTSKTARACPRTRRTSSGSGSAPPARPSSTTARRSSPSSTTQHRDVRNRKNAAHRRGRERSSRRAPTASPPTARLLDEWKAAGRAGKKNDDALWARFKAAGDAHLRRQGRGRRERQRRVRRQPQAKLALLDEAEPLLKATDRDERARSCCHPATVGRDRPVPRDQVKPVEDRLRRVEAAVRKLDEEHWEKNNPEKKARSEGLASQLNAAIAKLEHELADAQATRRQREGRRRPGGARRPQGLAGRARLTAGRHRPWHPSTAALSRRVLHRFRRAVRARRHARRGWRHDLDLPASARRERAPAGGAARPLSRRRPVPRRRCLRPVDDA